MSNLQAVKRMDKNGVLSTKHVRIDPKAKMSVSALPAPKAGPAKAPVKAVKAPTKGQLKPKPNAITASLEQRDPELLKALGIDADLGIYRFRASDAEIYDVLSVADNGTALALLKSGIKTRDAAENYLMDNGFEHLLTDNSAHAQEAQSRGIAPKWYFQQTRWSINENLSDPLFWDALEVTNSAALSYNPDLRHSVRNGSIRLADIKTVGATRLSKSLGQEEIETALTRIASGEAKYSAADLKEVIEKFGEQSNVLVENALTLTEDYGIDYAMSLRNPKVFVITVNEIMKDDGEDPERIKSVLKYFDDMDASGTLAHGGFEATMSNVIRFHDAGVSPADAASGKVTLEQLDAIEEHGINPSLSSGWL
jgi:hypothetical protein